MRQFVRTFEDSDGTTYIWKYDLDKFSRGPIETTINYPKEFLLDDGKQKNNKIDQKYINPANGKYVGYGRAKSLGLI
jgi:hypothetical protein